MKHTAAPLIVLSLGACSSIAAPVALVRKPLEALTQPLSVGQEFDIVLESNITTGDVQ
jgi:hypothetical protein